MSRLSFEIESELHRIVHSEFKRRTQVQCESITEDEVAEDVHKEFAEWLVTEFENRVRKIQITCAGCGAEWTTNHRCE